MKYTSLRTFNFNDWKALINGCTIKNYTYCLVELSFPFRRQPKKAKPQCHSQSFKKRRVFLKYLQGPVNQIPHDEQHHSVLKEEEGKPSKTLSLHSLHF